mmetsp:Transcript_20848/g.62207  ORF Transcript_20848/g.62207 Transcript_20848/m.62207 type:complete len:105 (+) Transcript_20848:173-487(+)
MSNPFVQRVANWLAQEVVVKGLSESKAFQRFALRTDAKIKEATKHVDPSKAASAVESVSNFAKSVQETVKREMTATPKPPPPREIAFKSKQEILAEARAAAEKK